MQDHKVSVQSDRNPVQFLQVGPSTSHFPERLEELQVKCCSRAGRRGEGQLARALLCAEPWGKVLSQEPTMGGVHTDRSRRA